ncbi:peptide methionine sulfoxide reductase [Lasius niger]|uniref:peptide-methionine (S)-S-oxide reductase n=1 Tax=Lasius niger TaxID=67767 RepID=A0A0J7K0A9_LASNI|nr:peptide methionine sulfoxide reductase [Lasius niger]
MSDLHSILLGAGCFWCAEAILKDLQGVKSVQSGFAGGTLKNPSYKDVCTGTTGHAEVVKVVYDSQKITDEDLLGIFFTIHDPTQLNRQGNDIGTQYRSVVFGNKTQQKVAQKLIQTFESQKLWAAPVVTALEDETVFWPADESHEDYFARNPENQYCAAIVAPKVAKARKMFRDRLKNR